MDRYSVSRTKRLLFYIIMTFLTVGFIVAECVLPSERSTSTSDENITYDGKIIIKLANEDKPIEVKTELR